MKLTTLLLLLTMAGFAADPDGFKQRCTRENRGSFWPEKANTDRSTRERAARCGQLQICTSNTWRMGWEPVSIPYWKLTGAATPDECEDLRAVNIANAKRARF